MNSSAATETPTPTLTWKCKCGKCQVKLNGEPAASFNCHCRTCTATTRYITEKYPDGATELSNLEQKTGSAMSLWYMKDINFFQGSPHENLGYTKVGPDGTVLRSYTKCCGTQAFVTGKEMKMSTLRHFNRNCLYNEDGSKYTPKGEIANIMLAFAFEDVDTSVLPEPRYKFASLKDMGVLMPNVIQKIFGGYGDKGENAEEPSMWVKSEDVTEVVPITW